MLSTLFVVLYAFSASVVAQSSSSSVVCVAGQCVQGSSNVTIGAKLSTPGGPVALHLLPGQYTSTTNPQLLHNMLTSSSASLTKSAGFDSASLSSLPLNLDLDPGLATYSNSRYSGQAAFTALPETLINSTSPLAASSFVLSTNVWAAISAGSNNERVVFWDAVPDVSQLPPSVAQSLTLVDLQSASCSPACAGNSVCSSSGTCTCPTGFTGSSCETCAEGFFGPDCQPCPDDCPECDQGLTGSGRCLTAPVPTSAPSNCNCLNGQCGNNGQCVCNVGWTTGTNGTACASCEPGFFLSSTGDCQVCQAGCSQCADSTAICASCKDGFVADTNDRSKCVPAPARQSNGSLCPARSFSTGSGCAACASSCDSCSGASSNQCLSCPSGSYFFNGNCVTADSNGNCQGTNGLIADNVKLTCDTCGAKCTSCQIPGFNSLSTIDQLQCTGCLPGLVLSEGKCVESCPAGSVVSARDGLTCTPCSSSCGTCAGTPDFCLTCSGSQLASDGQCVSTCPTGTFTSSGSCLKCHSDCATCSGSSFNQCSTCPPDRPVLTNGRCLPTCSKNQYFDKTSSSCQTCDNSCSSCSGPGQNNCLACSSSTQVLRGGSCVAANCNGASNVIAGLGVCLSEVVAIPTTTGNAPVPSITGVADPVIINNRRPLEWWQILLMALGCAFIFLMVVICCRRRMKKKRAKRTAKFATAKGLDNPRTWRQKLIRFGERFFGHNTRMRFGRPPPQPEVLPVHTPSTLPDLDANPRRTAEKYSPRRVDRDSIYSEITGKPRNMPEPKQPLRREEGVLVDLDEPSRPMQPPLQMLRTGSSSKVTEAEAYAMAVRPHLTSTSTGAIASAAAAQPPVIPPLPLGSRFNFAGVPNINGVPMQFTLMPDTTNGQGSYWFAPVMPQPQMTNMTGQTVQFPLAPHQPMDTVVIQPVNTGATGSSNGTTSRKNPFRQGSY
ncbi:insulin-like growth factor binding protein [Panaeolus papilionaceus]|nr:insulin-like growth factor binding protein [Panaeolus papilionaceus]